jgi:anti-sigma-K factor RskA
MDVKEYLSSGIIELYAIGTLSPEEMIEVEKMAEQYAEVRDELLLTQQTLNNYALAHSSNPRPALRAAIAEKMQVLPSEKKEPKVIQIKRSSLRTNKYLVAASLVALLVSTAATYFFYMRWNETADKYLDILNEKNVLAENYNSLKPVFDKTYSDLTVLRNENVSMFGLNAVDSTKDYAARVYWNRFTHEAFMDVKKLPMPPDSMQYQLWAVMDTTVMDAGMVSMNNEAGLQKMKPVMMAQAFAVTLEHKGGSPTPTLVMMYLHSPMPVPAPTVKP